MTPASSLASAVISGTVAVSNFPASQAVTGPLTDAQLRASAVPVSGTVAVSSVGGTVTTDGSGHTQPVSGTVAVSAVAGTVTVDGSAVTQPVSADSLPLPDGAATEATLVRVNGAVQDAGLTAILEREKIPA